MEMRTMLRLGALAVAVSGCGGAASAEDTSSEGETYEDDTSGGATMAAEPSAPADAEGGSDGVYDIEE